MNDHDLLIRIDERLTMIHSDVASLKRWTATHDETHARTKKVLAGIAAALGAVTGFLASLFR